MKRTFAAMAPAYLLAACAAQSAPPASMPSTITLLPTASAALAPGTSLRFDSVADSRCPRNVVCITAGELRYHFTLRSGDTSEAFSLTPESPEANTAAQLRFTLSSPPLPLAEASAPPAAPQPVTLTIHSQQ
jgi:hypothetical protein